jgi:hypothetical protein
VVGVQEAFAAKRKLQAVQDAEMQAQRQQLLDMMQRQDQWKGGEEESVVEKQEEEQIEEEQEGEDQEEQHWQEYQQQQVGQELVLSMLNFGVGVAVAFCV